MSNPLDSAASRTVIAVPPPSPEISQIKAPSFAELVQKVDEHRAQRAARRAFHEMAQANERLNQERRRQLGQIECCGKPINCGECAVQ